MAKPILDTARLKTLKLRVKDKHATLLRKMAGQVNTVFNFANETSERAIRERRKFMTGYELQKYVTGLTKCEGILISQESANLICSEYAAKRLQHKKRRLNWRVSNPSSSKYSLGWVPFRTGAVVYKSGQIRYAGHFFSLWDSYGLEGREFRSGSFNEDSRGRWYFNVLVRQVEKPSLGRRSVGIDLGLKTAITTSDGDTFEGRLYRATEKRLAIAQRAGKKRQAKTLNAKVKNQRKDGLHKFSTKLVQESGAIFVGDVSPAKMIKTKMAKSTHDAGWSMFKMMLEYKCHQAGVIFEVVPENYTTQTCNACGVIAGPRGRAGLNKRMWQCGCGAVHDRDVNAALNIRARGLASLAEGVEA